MNGNAINVHDNGRYTAYRLFRILFSPPLGATVARSPETGARRRARKAAILIMVSIVIVVMPMMSTTICKSG